MDEQQSTNSGSSKAMILSAIAVVLILAIVGGGFILFKNKENLPIENLESENSSPKTSQSSPAPQEDSDNSMMQRSRKMMASYKDGTYSATGSYFTPGGTEEIGLSITLKNGIITNSELTQQGKSPTAKIKQADFAENYKPFVVGKDIDEVNISVVSGSSLTSQGFKDALTQIKSQAKS